MNKLTDAQIQDVYDCCVSSLSDPDEARGFFEFLCMMEEDYQPEKVFIQLIDCLRDVERRLQVPVVLPPPVLQTKLTDSKIVFAMDKPQVVDAIRAAGFKVEGD